MKVFAPGAIRNVGLFGHMGNGKTSLSEAMLHTAAAISRMGRIDDGTTTSDFDTDEHRRRMSINLSLLPFTWRETKINLIDVPGYADFVGELRATQRVVDGAILVSCAIAGLEVGTEQAWLSCARRNLPRIAVINRMDRENADFIGTLGQLRDQFGNSVIAIQLPIGTRDTYSGHVDLISRKAFAYGANGAITEVPIPSDLEVTANRLADTLTEVVAETDDTLTMKFLEGETLTDAEVRGALRTAVRVGTITPVLATAGTASKGIAALLDAIVDLLPSPADIDGATPDGPLAALVFKTLADPFIGKLTFFRVYSGTLHADSSVWNGSHERDERIGSLMTMRGKTHEIAALVPAGDIGAVAKLAVTTTGDTLCSRDHLVALDPPDFPAPMFGAAVEARARADLDRMGAALQRIQDEDPTIKVNRDTETGQTIISGMGDNHIDITLEKIKRKFGADLRVEPMRIAYRETIRGKTRADGRFVRQTGGSGQYGVCSIELEPMPRGAGYEFVDRIVGGVISGSFRQAVGKGIQEKMADGVLAGYPMVDIKVTLIDGKEHAVDSSEMAFKIAGSLAFQKGIEQAGAILLEPVMRVAITVPDGNTGGIMSDLSTKRGRVTGMNPNGDGTTTVDAEVPMGEMVRYATDLRSLTQGRGTFTTTFDHYEEMPGTVSQKVIEDAKSRKAERG
ncbi:MAG: elongation factor G [Chloroflexi bacterium]|nr:elongation factor G [Chloroflexota bacterium]